MPCIVRTSVDRGSIGGIGMSEAEMVEGFLDGYDLDCPGPGPNRSAAYRHGFLNGRDDRSGEPRASTGVLRDEAERILNG